MFFRYYRIVAISEQKQDILPFSPKCYMLLSNKTKQFPNKKQKLPKKNPIAAKNDLSQATLTN